MARFCEKHMARSVDTLVSKKTGTEYDLCQVCETELFQILNETPKDINKEDEIGRKRTAGRPKVNKG